MSFIITNHSNLTLFSNLSVSPNNFRHELNQYIADINYVLSYIQAFICIMGILGNLLALIVINRKSLRNTSSAVFITYMSLFDSALLLLHAANLAKWRGHVFLHCSLTYLTDLGTFCANWVLVIITLERCIAVYSPFLSKRLCTVHSARRSMYILLTIAIIFHSITFPFVYHTDYTSKHQKCLVRVKASVMVRIYQPILFYAIPDLFLLSNLFTVYALCRRQKQLSCLRLNDEQRIEMRINDINSNRKQRQLTIMLVTVSLSFYLFTTPAIALYINEYSPIKHRELNKIKRNILFSQISVIFLQLNNATNFIFYSFAGQRFRRVTIQTIYDYSIKIKFIYHRYILCNKQYNSPTVCQQNLSHVGYTMVSARGSYNPYKLHHERLCRTSTF